MYTLLSSALAICIGACCVVNCASASVLIFFEEGNRDVSWVYTGLGTSLDYLRPIVAIMIDLSLIGDEGSSKLAIKSLIPIDALEDSMLANLIQRGPETRILHKYRLQETPYKAGNARSVPRFALYHVFVDLLRIFIMEGSPS